MTWRNRANPENIRSIPMAGVASVCRPTSWAGPSPSRKSLNWLLAPMLMPEKIKLQQESQQGAKSKSRPSWRHGGSPIFAGSEFCKSDFNSLESCSEQGSLLTLPPSCSCSCCRCWTPCWAGGSCSGSVPRLCRSRCSSEWERPSPSYSSLLEDKREKTIEISLMARRSTKTNRNQQWVADEL